MTIRRSRYTSALLLCLGSTLPSAALAQTTTDDTIDDDANRPDADGGDADEPPGTDASTDEAPGEAETTPSCRGSAACAARGQCSSLRGRCVARFDEDCAASDECRSTGRCGSDGAACVARSHARCEASTRCRTEGGCYASHGACVAARDSDCRRSSACRTRGLCHAVRGVCAAEKPAPPPESLSDWSEEAAGQDDPEDYRSSTRTRGGGVSVEGLASPGVSMLTGEGSGFFDPSFNVDLMASVRSGIGSVGARVRLNPFNPSAGSGSAFLFGASIAPALRPLEKGWFDLAVGANVGYFLIGAGGPGGNAAVHGMQVGPWAALLFLPNYEDDVRFVTGLTVDWTALIGLSACFNGDCQSVDYAGEGAATVGVVLGVSADM